MSNLSWPTFLGAAFVVGISIWLLEQNVSSQTATVLAIILLLGVAYTQPTFASELKGIFNRGS